MLLAASVLLCAQMVFGAASVSAPVNEYDKPFDWAPGDNRVLTGMLSVHNNGKEDRVWRFSTIKVDNLNCVGGQWTGYQNDWDGVLDFNCGAGKAIAGISSVHDNRREDRRWRFKCCTVSGGFAVVDSKATDFVNAYDGVLNKKCEGSTQQVLVGLYSIHDNRKEDRRWKLKCGRLTRVGADPTEKPTPTPTHSPTKTSTDMVVKEMMGLKTAVMGELQKVLNEINALDTGVKTGLMALKMQVSSLDEKCTVDEECEKAPPCNTNKGSRKCRAAAGCTWDKSSDPPQCIGNGESSGGDTQDGNEDEVA